MKINDYSMIDKSNWLYNEEYEYQYNLYAIFALIGFIGFYFLNSIAFSSSQYENLYFRLTAAFLALILLLRNSWPLFLKPYLRIYWYITLTFNLPIFFTFMLLQNNFSLEWQLNELMALTILAALTDFTTLLIISLLGISTACLSYYLIVSELIIPNNIGGLVISYITVLIFCSIYNYQKNKFYIRKLEFYHIDKINKDLEKKVSERTTELTDALSVKDEFLNHISHEIRTPIQGVSTISEELVKNWQALNDEKRFHYTSLVAKSAKRLFSLVTNLLDLSKYDQQELILDLRQVDLNSLVEDIIDECKTLYVQDKNIAFEFTSIEYPNILADQERLIQVFRNIIVNAIKYGPIENVISINITKDEITYNRAIKANAIRVTISDQGIGIPEKEIKLIFLPFVQSSKTRTKESGTGLGLAICKRIVDAHKGKIWAVNNPNRGASFIFVLPINPDESNKDNIKNISKLKTKSKLTIMVIDDEEIVLSTLELMLQNENYTIIKASTGITGLNLIRKNYDKIDLILLDLMMPDMYGINLLNELKKNKLTKHIPVIIQSGVADETEKKKCLKLGAFSFLSKPYNKKILLDKIKEIIG